MAEDIRPADSDPRMIEQRRAAIIAECRRQEESCLYTSTTLYIWLRRVRLQKQIFVAAPIVIGGIAGIAVLIPTALTTDRCPLSGSDGLDTIWIGNQEVPCGTACLDDLLIGIPDQTTELVCPQILPNIFHRVQFW